MDNWYDKLLADFGTPNRIIVNPKTFQDLLDIQAWEKRLNSLSFRQARQEVLKAKIKARKCQKHKVYHCWYYDRLLDKHPII